ncbi:glycoside hydrolase [Desulforhopalus sp. 52FAK]
MPYPSTKFSSLTEAQLNTYCNCFQEIILRTVNEFRPDIIHSHHLWLASSVAKRVCPDVPIVTSCHSTDLRQYLQHEHLRPRLDNISEIDRILALSNDQKQQISQIHGVNGDKISIVGGGYDADRFLPGEKESAPPIQFLYAGKLCNAKGVPFLLRAMAKLNDKRVHLHLVGATPGPEGEKCLELAAHMAGQVTVHGPLPQEELAKLMSKAHIFVLPSFFEGVPLVLLEALASGCRILCTNLPGCTEILGRAKPDIVRFIELPEMSDVDKITQDQSEPLIARIATGIEDMARVATESPAFEQENVANLTDFYNWKSVFSRVEKDYLEVTDSF